MSEFWRAFVDLLKEFGANFFVLNGSDGSRWTVYSWFGGDNLDAFLSMFLEPVRTCFEPVGFFQRFHLRNRMLFSELFMVAFVVARISLSCNCSNEK